MANATIAQPASDSAIVESLTARVAELERKFATAQAERADMQRQLAAQQAEKVGWRMTGAALAFLITLDIAIAGYSIMYSRDNDAQIHNRLDGIDNRLDRIEDKLDRALPPR